VRRYARGREAGHRPGSKRVAVGSRVKPFGSTKHSGSATPVPCTSRPCACRREMRRRPKRAACMCDIGAILTSLALRTRHGRRSSRSVAGAPSRLAGARECHLPELRAAGRATRGARSWDSSSTITSATTGGSEIKPISTASWIDLTTSDAARSTSVSTRALAEVTRQQTGCQSSTAKMWRRSWGRDGQCFARLPLANQ
jgi:hypothetical protein